MPDRPQKITFAEMRPSGGRGVLAYCADYRCSHSIAISGDGWPDNGGPVYRRPVYGGPMDGVTPIH